MKSARGAEIGLVLLAMRALGIAVARSSVAVALLLTVASCASLFPPGPPAQFTNRSELPTCGQEVRDHREGPDVAMRTCLLSAFTENRPAEFASTVLSVEGQPIVFHYRVWPTDDVPVEIFQDSSRDSFRSAAWTHAECGGLVPKVGPEVFDVAGCPDHQEVLVR